MPSTLTLSPGAVTLATHLPNLPPGNPSGMAGTGVYGAPPQWADASDASYARVGDALGVGCDYATAPIDTVVVASRTDILSAVLNVRIAGPSDTTSRVNFRIATSDNSGNLVGDADSLNLPATPFPAVGTAVTLTGVPLDYGDDIRDVLRQSSLAVYMWPEAPPNDIAIFEVSITVTLADPPPASPSEGRWGTVPI